MHKKIRTALAHPKQLHPTLQSDRGGYWMLILSNLFCLVPIFYTYTTHYVHWYVGIMIVQMCASVWYHADAYNTYARVFDWICAIVLISANLFVLFSFNIGAQLWIKILIAVLLNICAFRYFLHDKNYALSHSWWHVLCVLITLTVVW